MVGVAADHRADRDQRVEAAGLRQPLQRERDLERAGDRDELGLDAPPARRAFTSSARADSSSALQISSLKRE